MRYVPGRKPRRQPWPPRRKDDALFPGGDVRLLTSAPPSAFSGDRLPASPGPVPPDQHSQPELQTFPTGQPGTLETLAPRVERDIERDIEQDIEQDKDARYEPEPQPNAPNDAVTMINRHDSIELNFDERKETPAPSAHEQTALAPNEPATVDARRTNSMETNPTYIDLQNQMPEEFSPYETEIEAAAAAYHAAEKKKRAARKRELAAGRPTQKEVEQSTQLARFPLDDPKTAFATFARSLHRASSSAPPPDLARHARRCLICAHPDRDAIEGEFIRWHNPEHIARDYGIADRNSIYRHAHATGLSHRRRSEASRILEHVLERAESTPTEEFDVITRALRLYTCLDNESRFREPVHHVVHGQVAPPPSAAIEVGTPENEIAPADALPDGSPE